MDTISYEEFKELIVTTKCKRLTCSKLGKVKIKIEFWNRWTSNDGSDLVIEDDDKSFVIKEDYIRVINITRRPTKTLMCITYLEGSYIEVVLDLKAKRKAASNGTGNTSAANLQLKQNQDKMNYKILLDA